VTSSVVAFVLLVSAAGFLLKKRHAKKQRGLFHKELVKIYVPEIA